MNRLVLPTILAFLVTGCASNPDKIAASYVSPLKYNSYNCDQIGMEMEAVARKTTALHSELQKERTADNWQTGVGLVLFWPALFFLEGGDGPEAVEYASLKGEFEALRESSVAKQCTINTKSPEEIMKEAEEASKENKA